MNTDNVLPTVGMGRYQLISCALFGVMILYTNITSVLYIFTASDLKYRCEIPECEPSNPADRIYEPDWLRFTTPYHENTGRPQKCQRYVSSVEYVMNGTRCGSSEFRIGNKTESCHDHWVFQDYENTIATEFALMCEENKWKLSMVGTIHNLGQFIGMPVSGIVSDKYGRKFTMISGAVMAATTYIIQSFSTSYPMFLILEIISSTIFSGVYTATFILAMELVLPKKRVLYYSILECFNPVGGMVVALIASQTKNWRILLRISNTPALLFLLYFWLTNESLRWLATQGKHDRVNETLKRISSINQNRRPDLSLNTEIKMSKYNVEENITEENNAKVHTSILKDIFRSSSIFWRMIRCSITWIGATLVYYGLNISSTDIAGNKYLNFTLVSFIEIPACLLTWVIMEKMSRKISLLSMFMLSGFTCVMYNLTPDNFGLVLKLFLFMTSKLAISIAFSIIYILTAEIFPTSMRATMISLCSMFGRIGSMLAPQITLLSEYFGEYTAMLLMGTAALVAAVVTMTLPESKNVKLPDTIDEAEQIGNELVSFIN